MPQKIANMATAPRLRDCDGVARPCRAQ